MSRDSINGRTWLRTGYERHQAGDLVEAAKLYRRAARVEGVRADALHGLGLVELQRGRPEAAVEALDRAARLIPDNPAVQTNLGHALMSWGRHQEALAPLRRAVALAPQAETSFNLAYCEQSAGNAFAAERGYRQVLAETPAHSGARNNLAGLLHGMGRVAEATDLYRTVLSDQPGDIEVAFNLALAEEVSGHLDASRELVASILHRQPDEPRALLLQARLDRRAGALDAAAARLTSLVQAELPDDMACSARKELALVLDRQGQYAKAFALVVEGNALRARQARRQGVDGANWLRRLELYQQHFSSHRLSAARENTQAMHAPPVFFVGFPRSGTTLMETILATHPALFTSGEITPLDHVLRALAPSGRLKDLRAALGDLDAGGIDRLRGVFWDAARGLFGDRLADRRLVDKAPFNLVELGLINLLFPDSPVIVAQRDPRDVCLSCFFQDFTLSDAVANFLDISDTARAYVAANALWRHYSQVLTMPTLTYCYEDLVADPAAVSARVFDFLGLQWSDDRLSVESRQAAAHYIGTPSREAVSQPITGSAVARWRRYRAELEPILPILAPILPTSEAPS